MQQTAHKEYPYKDSADARIPNPKIFEPVPLTVDTRLKPGSAVSPQNPAFSARYGLSWPQKSVTAILVLCLVPLGFWQPALLLSGLYGLAWSVFMANALLRLAAVAIKPVTPQARPSLASDIMPAYSVIVALYKEAALAPQIIQAMSELDYPRDRLEILIALEADDADTIAAFRAQTLPGHMRIIEVPRGFPRTKPRALNHALEHANGEHIVIYDAEDRPHPGQLRDAASAFADGDVALVCLQAPLRPVGGQGFIARQFAAEYAVQFEVLLPALNHLGLPFPLGGTSNHFKADVLKSVGGWDAYNVTEDADLGLRLAQYGYMCGLITCPTIETPPTDIRTWIPQRTRWIKGYFQTLLVHTRLTTGFPIRVWLGVGLSLAMSTASAVCYAPFTILVLLSLLISIIQGALKPDAAIDILHWPDLLLCLTGSLSAISCLSVGARRAGLRLTVTDIMAVPAYWCLQSLAAGFAIHQFFARRFHWDKTEHTPASQPDKPHKALYEDKSSAYGLEDDYIGHPHHLADHRLG